MATHTWTNREGRSLNTAVQRKSPRGATTDKKRVPKNCCNNHDEPFLATAQPTKPIPSVGADAYSRRTCGRRVLRHGLAGSIRSRQRNLLLRFQPAASSKENEWTGEGARASKTSRHPLFHPMTQTTPITSDHTKVEPSAVTRTTALLYRKNQQRPCNTPTTGEQQCVVYFVMQAARRRRVTASRPNRSRTPTTAGLFDIIVSVPRLHSACAIINTQA